MFKRLVDVTLAITSPFFPAANAIHILVQLFTPNCDHEEIMEQFGELRNMIHRVEVKFDKSRKEDKWERVNSRYLDAILEIKNSVKLSLEIVKAEDPWKQKNWTEELKEAAKRLPISLDYICDGLQTGENKGDLND